MEELVETEPQNLEDAAIDRGERSAREMFNEEVTTPLPSHGTDDDVGGERALPLVGEALAASRQCGGKIGASLGHHAERVIRGDARLSGHGEDDEIDELTDLRIYELHCEFWVAIRTIAPVKIRQFVDSSIRQ